MDQVKGEMLYIATPFRALLRNTLPGSRLGRWAGAMDWGNGLGQWTGAVSTPVKLPQAAQKSPSHATHEPQG